VAAEAGWLGLEHLEHAYARTVLLHIIYSACNLASLLDVFPYLVRDAVYATRRGVPWRRTDPNVRVAAPMVMGAPQMSSWPSCVLALRPPGSSHGLWSGNPAHMLPILLDAILAPHARYVLRWSGRTESTEIGTDIGIEFGVRVVSSQHVRCPRTRDCPR
jgi:hypothetical protein